MAGSRLLKLVIKYKTMIKEQFPCYWLSNKTYSVFIWGWESVWLHKLTELHSWNRDHSQGSNGCEEHSWNRAHSQGSNGCEEHSWNRDHSQGSNGCEEQSKTISRRSAVARVRSDCTTKSGGNKDMHFFTGSRCCDPNSRPNKVPVNSTREARTSARRI